jgi:ubiquitin-protein ligase E3 B
MYLEHLTPEFAADSRSMLLHLRTLVSFTSTSSWALLKTPTMERLVPGMNQLCANVMGHLFSKGFYKVLQVSSKVVKKNNQFFYVVLDILVSCNN